MSTFTRTDGGTVTEERTLDDAWRDAEAALPEGWHNGPLLQLFAYDLIDGGRYYSASVENPVRRKYQRREWIGGDGPTPIAALDALTAKLLERAK